MEEKTTCSRIFTCKECNFIFKKRAHLLRHQLIHNDERPFKCTQCEKSFRSSFHLNRHAASHAGVKSFKCPYEGCQVSCLLEWNLKRHVKRTHMGKFKCEKCGEEFRKNKLLQHHMSTEHKSVICCEFPGCVQTFTVPWKMKQHLKMHKEKAYVCPVKDCSQKFNFWSECRLHTAECKKREVSCDVCGKTFRTRSNMKAHRKIHSEEREVFQCTYEGCGRFYTKQSNLKVHVQSFHMNIRPFVCTKDGCNKRFHFQHLLRNHYENIHDKKGVDEAEEKERKPKPKPKPKSRRINNPSTVSSITGYIPELWTRMTPEEVKCYVEGKPFSESEGNSTDTTQAEMPPILKPNEVEMRPNTEEQETIESPNSEGVLTDDTVPVKNSSDEFEQITELVEIKPFMYKPVVKLVKKSVLNNSAVPLSYANVVNSESSTDDEREECMITNENDNIKSESIKMNPEECIRNCSVVIPKIDLPANTEQCMKEFSARFRSMFDQTVTANSLNIHGMCVIQSMNESDSSDSDVQNKQVACVV